MKHPFICLRTALILSAVFITPAALAGTATWNGGGQDNLWQNPGNWGGTPPSAGDALIFQGTVRLNNTNNFSASTPFNGITFASPSAAFNLFGNPISLTSDIVDNQVVVNETINLSLSLDATHNLNVSPGGSLVLRGPISGTAGAGLTLPGGGQLTLAATNTFTGPITINAGTLTVFSDANLGSVDASPTAGRLVINGGTLQTTNTFAIADNRGIAVGPPSGAGSGTFDVNQGAAGTGQPILTYRGVISNNGTGTGGLTKIGYGALTLAGANTYTGPTALKNGLMTLDFNQASSPLNNIINSSSALTLGGATSGRGVTNYAGLVVIPKSTATVNSQTFNNTFIDIGEAFVQGTSNNLGAININLGALTHTNGGVVNIIPPTLQGGNGRITTTATNVNGILGGWVTIGDGHLDGNRRPFAATNWASVDGNGNIVNYTGYTVYSSGNLSALANPANNVYIPTTISGDIVLDTDLAGTTNDFNTIAMNRSVGWTLQVGTSNILRLGKSGAIFSQLNSAGVNWGIGGGSGGTAGPQGGAGFITAGGPTVNTPGELIVINNTTGSGSGNNMALDSQIIDNGTGVVTLVKAGPGFLKLRNHNSYSGGTYILQGRIQIDGSLTGGTPIFDVFGTGPVTIFPGGNLFFSGTAVPLPNEFFVAGNSTQQEPGIGCIRTAGGWAITNTVHLIGDTTIGGNGGVSGAIGGKITGPFNLSLGSAGTVNGTISISNSLNDWTGDTTIQGRTLNNSGSNVFISGSSEIIPNGFGKGNVIMSAGTTAAVGWNLNNMTETINGLTAVNPQNCYIGNGGSLTVGDNDQSGTFAGTIQDAISLTKIGGGTETFTGDKLTYTGVTTVSGGTLALTGNAGALPNSLVQVNAGAVLDASTVSGGAIAPTGIGIDSGRFIANAAGSSMNILGVTNSHLQVVLNPSVTSISGVSGLTTGGTTNLLDVTAIQNVASYPAQFTVIKYSGAIGGNGFNFGLGAVPTGTTTGYVSNNVANGSIDIVLFNGPKLLSWSAAINNNWDIVGTANWKFGAVSSVYNDQDSVLFDDTASQTAVNLTTMLTPANVIVNSTSNYVFGGIGNITGFGSLTKSGNGRLTIANTGVDNYSGGVTVNGGTLSFGVNNNISGGAAINGATLELTAGNLPSGSMAIAGGGVLLLNDTGSVVVNNNISDDGSGLVIKTNTGTATLGGLSTYNGQTLVSQGTLVAGSGLALGSTSGNTVVSNGATLDVGGQNLGAEPVVVSGSGVGGNGAIVNSGAAQQNALISVTLAGNTTFGGTNRWDIRGTGAQLVSDGNGFYNLTKVGTNQVSLVGASVDGTLSNIFVQAGIFGVETTTSGNLGENTFSKLTVSPGATLEMFNNGGSFITKPLVFNGDGLADSLLNNSGANHISSQTIVLNSGNCIFDIGGTSLGFEDNGGGNMLTGAGSLTKTGAGTLFFNILPNYAGPTVVSNGILVLNVPETNTSSISVGGGILAVGANGWIASPVSVLPGGTLSPGDTNTAIPAFFTLAISNTLSLAGNVAMDVTKNGDATFTSDAITNVTTLTFGGALSLTLDTNASPLVIGDSIKLFSFNSASGAFASIVPSPGPGLAWDQSHLATDGTLRVKVASAASPQITGIHLNGTTVSLTATNGSAGANWTLLQSTNLSLPISLWESNRIVTFDGNGNLSTNIPSTGTNAQEFYLLKQ
jgi:fibronectin-binding autotransporter adhesin